MLEISRLKSPHPFAANTYLICSSCKYAVVDPTVPYSPDICNGDVEYVLLTHAHFDHILEVDSWIMGTGARVIISEEEKSALADPLRNCFRLYNGTENGYFGEAIGMSENQILMLGDTEVRMICLPGHTSGSAAYLCEDVAFVGDTVFAGGGFGRFDLPSGNFVMLRDSINKILALPDHTVLYPGHGESTTVKEYKLDYRR